MGRLHYKTHSTHTHSHIYYIHRMCGSAKVPCLPTENFCSKCNKMHIAKSCKVISNFAISRCKSVNCQFQFRNWNTNTPKNPKCGRVERRSNLIIAPYRFGKSDSEEHTYRHIISFSSSHMQVVARKRRRAARVFWFRRGHQWP